MASGTWNVDANGNWSLATNWASSIIADGATFTANLTNNITATRTVTVDSTRTIGNVTFSDAGASGSSWILAGTSTLTLDNGGSSPVLNVITGTTISAPLSGTAGFTKSGAGSLTVTTVSNGLSTGTVRVQAGDLRSGNQGATVASNIFPAIDFWQIDAGASRTVWHSGAGYTCKPLLGSGIFYVGNDTAATNSATNGIGFDVSNFTGTLSAVSTQNSLKAFIRINSINLTGQTYLDFRNEGGTGSTFTQDFTFPAAASVGVAANPFIVTYSSAVSPTGTPVWNTSITADQTTGSVLIGSITRESANGVNTTATLTLQGSSTSANTVSGIIANGTYAIAIAKAGSNKWILSGANTYTGATRPSAGTLGIGNALALQNSPLDLISTDTGTVDFGVLTAATFGGLTTTSGSARNFTIPSNVNLTLNPATGITYTYAGVLDGDATAALTKANAGTQILTGTNTLLGTVTVNGGTLTAGANGTTGTFGAASANLVVGSGATASVNRSNAYQMDGNITGTGTFSKVTGTGTLTLTGSTISVSTMTLSAGTTEFSTTGTQTVSSAIGSTGPITKSGSGTTTFSSAGTNTGNWAVNAGTLNVTAAQSGTGGTITVASTGSLTGTGAISKPITINASSVGNNFTVDSSAALTNSGTATITGAAGTTRTVTANVGSTTTLTGVFGALVTNGTGTSFTGTTSFSSTTQVGTGSGISTITFPANTTLTGAVTIGGNASAYTSAKFAGTSLGVGNNNIIVGSVAGSTAYSYLNATAGTIGGRCYFGFGVGGALIGPALVDVNGAVFNNAALGASTVQVGSSITGQGILNVLSGTHSVAATEVGYSNVTSGSYQQIMVVDNASWTGATLTMRAASSSSRSVFTVRNGGLASFTGLTATSATPKDLNLWGGTFQIAGNWDAATTGAARIALYGSNNKLSVASGSTYLAVAIQQPSGSGVTSIAVSSGGSGYIGPPAVRISGGGGTGATARAVVDLTVGSPTYGQLTDIIVTSPGENYTSAPTVNLDMAGGFTSAAVVGTVSIGAGSNDGNIEKIDGGTLALTATNTNTGTYTVTGGTLRIGNATDAGTLGLNDASNAVVGSNAVLAFGRSTARTYPGIISGAGTIAVNGGGRATLSGVNTFTSAASAIAITTTGSVLRVTNGDSIGQGTSFGITVAANTALEIDGTSGNITTLPAKALTLNGTGISTTGALLNVAGNNTYSGTITLTAASGIGSNAGTLSLTSASAITSSTGGLSFYGAGDIDITSAVNIGGSAISKASGAGAAILRGTSTYTGTTTVNTGYLGYTTSIVASTAGSFGNASSGITVVEGAGVRYYGSGSATFSRNLSLTGATAGGIYKLESNGTGAVTHSAATYGTINVAKTLQLGGTGTAANTISFAVANNGTGAVTITKADAGTWVLSNTSNSYTGGTSVTGGTLKLSIATWASGTKVTGTGGITVSTGAKIQTLTGSGANAQNGRHTYPSLTFAANSRIRIGG